MAFPPITALPTPPNRATDTQVEFSNNTDAFLGALNTFRAQVNAAGDYIDDAGDEIKFDVSAASASAAASAASATSSASSATSSATSAGQSAASANVASAAAITALDFPDGQVLAHLNALKSIERKCTELFRFADEDYGFYDAATLTFKRTPVADAMSVVRASTATVNHPQGMVTYPTNGLRIAYDPVTGERLGALVERTRTRLNTIAALPTAPEIVAVTAAAHTISFSGTGSVTLSGAASGTLNGTGSAVVSLTFTPSAGALTITPSGSVVNLQLELGAFATSRIIGGEGAQVTRASDDVSKALGVASTRGGALLCEFVCTGLISDAFNKPILRINNVGNSGNRGFSIALSPTNVIYALIRNASTQATVNSLVTAANNTWYRVAATFDDDANTVSISVNGGGVVTVVQNVDLATFNTHLHAQGATASTGTAGPVPTIYRESDYLPYKLTDAELIAWSKP